MMESAPELKLVPLTGTVPPGLMTAVPLLKVANSVVEAPCETVSGVAVKAAITGAFTTVICVLAEYPVGETELAVMVYVPADGAVQLLPEKVPPFALQVTAELAEPLVVALKCTTSPLLTVEFDGVGVLTDGVPRFTVTSCETESPARLVTVNVKVFAAVSVPVATACPLLTEPRPAIWPVPLVNTGVIVAAAP